MNFGPVIFLGAFGAMLISWWAMVMAPVLQLGDQQPKAPQGSTQLYPIPATGLADRGREVYRANGCYYCHTQVVRHRGYDEEGGLVAYGADAARGWGARHSVAQDYLYEDPLMLGTVRMGPDLSNIGARQTNAVWHLLHLYNPESTSPGSTMPPYQYLFEKRKIRWQRSPDALEIEGLAEPGFEIVPRPEARALVAYLLSLKAETPLFSAPIPSEEEPGSTNAVSEVSTNATTVAP